MSRDRKSEDPAQTQAIGLAAMTVPNPAVTQEVAGRTVQKSSAETVSNPYVAVQTLRPVRTRPRVELPPQPVGHVLKYDAVSQAIADRLTMSSVAEDESDGRSFSQKTVEKISAISEFFPGLWKILAFLVIAILGGLFALSWAFAKACSEHRLRIGSVLAIALTLIVGIALRAARSSLDPLWLAGLASPFLILSGMFAYWGQHQHTVDRLSCIQHFNLATDKAHSSISVVSLSTIGFILVCELSVVIWLS